MAQVERLTASLMRCVPIFKQTAQVWTVAIKGLVMRFRIGGYYKHSGGGYIHILARLTTTVHGNTLIAECDDGSFKPVGDDEENAINWVELDDITEWDNLFS